MNKLLYFALFIVISFLFLVEAQNTCYCDWYPLPLLSKSENGTIEGSLHFGYSSMEVNHNFLAVGAPIDNGGLGSVSVYTRFANFPYWTFRTVLSAGRSFTTASNSAYYFGQYLAVFDDANIVIAENGPTTGTANPPMLYSYERSGPNTWINVQAPFSLTSVARFGGLGGYNKLLVVANNGATRPYGLVLLNKQGYNWVETSRIANPEKGNSVYTSISVASFNIFAASTTTASVHVFTRTSGLGFQPTILQTGGGNAVTIELHPDGTTLFVGLPASIQVYARNANGSFPSTPTVTYTLAGNTPFSGITTIRARGSTVVVGDSRAPPSTSTLCAPSSTTTGAVYVFSRVGTTLTLTNTLRPSDLEDAFGSYVAFDNTQGNIITAGGSYDTVYTFIEQGDVATPPCPTTVTAVSPSSAAASVSAVAASPSTVVASGSSVVSSSAASVASVSTAASSPSTAASNGVGPTVSANPVTATMTNSFISAAAATLNSAVASPSSAASGAGASFSAALATPSTAASATGASSSGAGASFSAALVTSPSSSAATIVGPTVSANPATETASASFLTASPSTLTSALASPTPATGGVVPSSVASSSPIPVLLSPLPGK